MASNFTYMGIDRMIPDESRRIVLVEGYGSESSISFNESSNSDLIMPIQFREMSQNSRNCVILYLCLFVIAVFGNISVFISVLRQIFKFRVRTRIMLLILHLSIADLIVTFFLIPMEILWRISIQWYGGNLLCKVCQFFRAFGLYLSSLVIICISLDRYFAIIHPLLVINGKKTVKYMLACAWAAAICSSLPQTLIFSVKSHPIYDFKNCVSIGFFNTQEQEILYNVFSIVVMYFAPLIVIICTYSLILRKITEKTKEHKEILRVVSNSLKLPVPVDYKDRRVLENEKKVMLEPSRRSILQNKRIEVLKNESNTKPQLKLRRSDNGTSNIMRARNRTLRLTLVIVVAFVLCSTPYIFMVLWYMFDRDGASKVDDRVQDIFFMMAVANSIANPLIYGSYTKGCNVFCGISSYFTKRRSENNSQKSNATAITAISRKSYRNNFMGSNQAKLQFYTQPNNNQVICNTIVPIVIPKVHSTRRE